VPAWAEARSPRRPRTPPWPPRWRTSTRRTSGPGCGRLTAIPAGTAPSTQILIWGGYRTQAANSNHHIAWPRERRGPGEESAEYGHRQSQRETTRLELAKYPVRRAARSHRGREVCSGGEHSPLRRLRRAQRTIRSSPGANPGLPRRQAGFIARLGIRTPSPDQFVVRSSARLRRGRRRAGRSPWARYRASGRDQPRSPG
jgi:hypothetical protein